MDPYIFFKHDQVGKLNLNLLISMHVDNLLIGGSKWRVEQFVEQFIEYLKIKRLGQLKKHLGVWWHWKVDPVTGEIFLNATMPKMP